MMKKHRSLLLALLVPALLLVSVFVVVGGAQQASNSSVKAGRWSDPATWADKKVPAEGAIVTINQGMDVVLDVNTPPLHGLTINGKLSFANNKDLELTTEWIMLHGELEIGTEKAPHTRKATITFTNNVKDEDISGVGGTTDKVDRGIMLMGGTLNLHGDRTNTWTKLARTADAGSNSIAVLNAAGSGVHGDDGRHALWGDVGVYGHGDGRRVGLPELHGRSDKDRHGDRTSRAHAAWDTDRCVTPPTSISMLRRLT